MTLFKVRHSKDMTLRELSTKSGLKPSRICDIETGRKPATNEDVAAMVSALQMPMIEVVQAIVESVEHEKKVQSILDGNETVIFCTRNGCHVGKLPKKESL